MLLPSEVVLTRHAHRKDDRRLHPPEPVKPYEGLYYVRSYGNACPQQRLVLPNGLGSQLGHDINEVIASLYDALRPTDEDCEYPASLSRASRPEDFLRFDYKRHHTDRRYTQV
jgi:hypothetical protein